MAKNTSTSKPADSQSPANTPGASAPPAGPSAPSTPSNGPAVPQASSYRGPAKWVDPKLELANQIANNPALKNMSVEELADIMDFRGAEPLAPNEPTGVPNPDGANPGGNPANVPGNPPAAAPTNPDGANPGAPAGAPAGASGKLIPVKLASGQVMEFPEEFAKALFAGAQAPEPPVAAPSFTPESIAAIVRETLQASQPKPPSKWDATINDPQASAEEKLAAVTNKRLDELDARLQQALQATAQQGQMQTAQQAAQQIGQMIQQVAGQSQVFKDNPEFAQMFEHIAGRELMLATSQNGVRVPQNAGALLGKFRDQIEGLAKAVHGRAYAAGEAAGKAAGTTSGVQSYLENKVQQTATAGKVAAGVGGTFTPGAVADATAPKVPEIVQKPRNYGAPGVPFVTFEELLGFNANQVGAA